MREIPLHNGMVALVDDEDFDRLVGRKWFAVRAKQASENWYAYRNPLPAERASGLTMHRQILAARPGSIVDHADGNGLNNTRANLRLCNQSLNNANRKQSVGVSGFRGVYPKQGRWQARIWAFGQDVTIGTFADRLSAALAYDRAAIAAFGQFATTNFPPERSAA